MNPILELAKHWSDAASRCAAYAVEVDPHEPTIAAMYRTHAARHRATAALLRELDNKRTYAWTSQPFNIGMEETSDRLMEEIR